MKDLFVAYATRVKKATDEEMEMGGCADIIWKSVFMRTSLPQVSVPPKCLVFVAPSHFVGQGRWHGRRWMDAKIKRSAQKANCVAQKWVA